MNASTFTKYHKEKWMSFIQRYEVISKSCELFDTKGYKCKIRSHGKDNKLLLCRSSEMEESLIKEARLVEQGFDSNQYQGLIYMMFKEHQREVVPLYIGKTEKYGKTANRISANIKNLRTNKGKFARWGDGYQYHIGDLSAVTLEGHHPDKRTIKYRDWAKTLFVDFPSNIPTLKEPVKFWCVAWRNDYIGVWEEFGPANLTFLEYQLIGLTSSLYPKSLLNREGQNR
jgi:hypothetical protein